MPYKLTGLFTSHQRTSIKEVSKCFPDRLTKQKKTKNKEENFLLHRKFQNGSITNDTIYLSGYDLHVRSSVM